MKKRKKGRPKGRTIANKEINKYRGRHDIMIEILQGCQERWMNQTGIMWRARLSHAQLRRYLKNLLENKLIMLDKNGYTYNITQKGALFLRTMKSLKLDFD